MLKAALLLAAIPLSGCVTEIFDRSGGFDSRPVTVQTVDLFNQRTPSRLAKKSWKGDWIFRRDRLDLIDQELRNAKPDLLVLQSVMAREGSGAESDYKILKAGSLIDYDWRLDKVETYDDTQETQALAIALGASLRFVPVVEGERDSWVMGASGYLMAATVDYEDQPLLVFNVQMPEHSDNENQWFTFLEERIRERIVKAKSCMKRVVVTGYLPGDDGASRYVAFLQKMRLRDAAQGFCQIANKCFTATPTNDLFMATIGDESPTRTDKVFVHQSALVYTSARIFEEGDANNRYVKEYGLTRLWPTQRLGWIANTRLARCSAAEIAQPLGT